MNNPLELYAFAENHDIDIDWLPLSASTSLSMPFTDGSYGIAIDPWKVDTLELETVLLAHELGHCITGAFYNRWAARDVREKHECKAWRWAYKKLVPKDELEEMVAAGFTDTWDLAEHFNVPDDFLIKAIDYYKTLNVS